MSDEDIRELVRHAGEIQQRLAEVQNELRNYRIATFLFAIMLVLLIVSKL